MESYNPDDYRGSCSPTWCAGCSCYGVLGALTGAFSDRHIDPNRMCVVSGIGCSSRMPLFLNTHGLHTLHGRALPVAVGLRLARPDLPVVVVAGDGDFFSIGTSHFVHAARGNFNMTVLCIDNRRYAMTKNQASPTSPQGYPGSLSPAGACCRPLNVVEFAIACNASFVARSFAGDPGHLRKTISRAMEHRGFSFVEIIAPCAIYDAPGTNAALSSHMVRLPDEGLDVSDRVAALARAARALDHDEKQSAGIEIGVFYRVDRPVCEDRGAPCNTHHHPAVQLPDTVLEAFAL